MLTHLSLFSGIGGIDLAAEWAGFETVGQCEWKDYPTKILEKHWPNVPRWRDIRELSANDFIQRTGIRAGELDLISGGFPCQPFSVAGNQKGKEDERYLWPEMYRVIGELHPAYILGENVPGILHIAADDVCKDLEREGYEVGIFNYEAAAVGAPHRRERFLFTGRSKDMAHTNGSGYIYRESKEYAAKTGKYAQRQPIRRSENVAYSGEFGHSQQEARESNTDKERNNKAQEQSGRTELYETIASSKNMAYTYNEGLEITGHKSEQHQTVSKDGTQYSSSIISDSYNSSSTRYGKYSRKIHAKPESERFIECCSSRWWAIEPELGRVANGIPNRVDRLQCLGNAVVPYQVYPILRAIAILLENNIKRS